VCAVLSLSGAVYSFVYDKNTNQWSEWSKVSASDGSFLDEFGGAVSLFLPYLAVGATGAQGGQTGAVYVYSSFNTGEAWTERQKLSASDGSAGDKFGYDLSLYYSTLIVSAPFKASSTGSVYVFDSLDDGASWTELQIVYASDEMQGSLFGISLSLSGPKFAVGSYRDEFNNFMLKQSGKPVRLLVY
jgi:hypothetical protein